METYIKSKTQDISGDIAVDVMTGEKKSKSDLLKDLETQRSFFQTEIQSLEKQINAIDLKIESLNNIK